MFADLRSCSIAVILFLRIIQGSPISLNELTAQHSEDLVRQTKSSEMRQYFNESADPCEDFFEFTCGNYAKYYPTNTTTSSLDRLQTAMHDKIEKELKLDDLADTDADKNVKNFYRSCLHVPALLTEYKDKLRVIIKEFGQMPVLEGKWQEADFDWRRLVSQMSYKSGQNILFTIKVATDFSDNSLNRLMLTAPPFSLNDISLYVDAAIPGEREKLKTNMAQNLHTFLGVEEDQAKKTAQEILDFEIALAYGMDDNKSAQPLSEIYPLKSLEEVRKKYLTVWDTKQLIGEAMGFTPHELIVENQYLENTYKVLQTASPKAVANYVFYSYISSFMIEPEEVATEMAELCITTTMELLQENVVNLIYRKYFSEQMKEGVHFLWQELKVAFKNTLLKPRLQWMHEDTRKYAVKKLQAMKLEILTYEQNNFTAGFGELDLNNHDYVNNLKAIWTELAKQARAKFFEPARQDMDTSFTPYNEILENTVKIPIDVIQPYYAWSRSYPYAYNFGTLGFYLAHEIMHGFDQCGRTFDGKGNLHDWWDLQSEGEFRDRTKCFVDQYKLYSYGGRPLPEMPAQGENIADNGGVRLAYEAYLNWLEKNVESTESFPDLSYSHRQLFFISYGQVWCSATHPDYMATHAARDVHAPEEFRVIGPLSNFDEFSKEFNCPKGSAMNPLKKCEIY